MKYLFLLAIPLVLVGCNPATSASYTSAPGGVSGAGLPGQLNLGSLAGGLLQGGLRSLGGTVGGTASVGGVPVLNTNAGNIGGGSGSNHTPLNPNGENIPPDGETDPAHELGGGQLEGGPSSSRNTTIPLDPGNELGGGDAGGSDVVDPASELG